MNALGATVVEEGLGLRRVIGRFVIGHHHGPCNSTRLVREIDRHGDFALVDSPDCKKWHSAEKVHKWFQYALVKWPRTPWLAKMEDDGMLWPAALAADLSALRNSTYYGVMRWAGMCSTARDKQCYAGSFLREVPSCEVKDQTRCNATKHCCEPLCPGRVVLSPFACGPLDVRHRSLAQQVASCAVADAFFREASATGDARETMAATTDASQAVALSQCVRVLQVADATEARLASGKCDRCSRCARGQVVVHHARFLKKSDKTNVSRTVQIWKDSWHSMTQWQPYTPAPLPEFQLRFDGASPMRIFHPSQNRQNVRFSEGRLPVYHWDWMLGAQGTPSCNGGKAGGTRAAPTAQMRGRRLFGRRLKQQYYEGCLGGSPRPKAQLIM